MKISLCMIVKDEEINIKECLDRALDVVDEVVIVDTGSVDSTLKILEQYKNRNVNVIEQKWNNDFSEARNKSIENANGDYILILDADERIFCKREKLEEFLIYDDGLAYKIPIYNIFENKEMQITAEMIRLYKNQNPLYVGAIHEQITFDGKKNIGKVLDDSICKIYHYGYSKKVFSAKDKQKRNMDIIMAEIGRNPKDAFNWYNKGVMEMIAENYDIALNDFIKAHNLTKGTRMAFHNDLIIKMIQCLLMQKRYKKTIEFISPLLKDIYINTLPDLYYYLGLAYKEIKKYSMAKKNLLKALKIGDSTQKNSKFGIGSYMPLVELARIEKENKNIEKAYEKYEEAIFHENNINKYGLDEYRHFLKENNEENLLNDLNNRINKNSSNNQKYSEVKMIEYKKQFKENIEKLIEANMLNEATEMIYEYEKMFGKDILTFSVNGILSIIKGDYINAEKNFLQGLEKDSDDFDLLYNLGYLYRNIKNIDNAIKYLKSAFINSPNSEMEDEVFSILKELDIDETKESLRIKIYKSKEDSSKKNDNETNNINDITTLKDKFKQNIQILIEEGSLSEAKILISEYNDFEKNDADIYSMQGIIAIMENDYEYAEQLFFEGLEIDNSNLDLLYNLGYLNELKCQFINAYRYYQKALKFAENTIRNSICEKIENLLKHDNVVNYTKRKKVLFVAHIFPPVGGSGVQRSLKFVKYLRDFGWEPIVVTVGKTVYPLKDETMISEIPEEVEVIRIDERDNINPEYVNQLIKLYSGIVEDDELIQEYVKELNKSNAHLNRLLLMPDIYILWATEILEIINSKIDFSEIDILYTTSGPYSDHLIGYYLKKRFDMPWVADFRDEWTNNSYVNFDKKNISYRLSHSMESKIVDLADRIVVVTPITKENYEKNFILEAKKVYEITNGYDEKDFVDLVYKNNKNEKFTVVHNGLLYMIRTPETFLNALISLINKKKIDKNKIIVKFPWIENEDEWKKYFKKNDLDNIVEITGYLTHKESLEMSINADLLLLIIGKGSENKTVYTGKVFEYLRLCKPILSLSPKDSLVDRLINDTSIGTNVEFDDVQKIEKTILEAYKSWENNELPVIEINEEIQKFERRNLTQKLCNLFYDTEYEFMKNKIDFKKNLHSKLNDFINKKKFFEAEEFLLKFLKSNPQNSYILFIIGNLYLYIEEFFLAYKFFEESLEYCNEPLERLFIKNYIDSVVSLGESNVSEFKLIKKHRIVVISSYPEDEAITTIEDIGEIIFTMDCSVEGSSNGIDINKILELDFDYIIVLERNNEKAQYILNVLHHSGINNKKIYNWFSYSYPYYIEGFETKFNSFKKMQKVDTFITGSSYAEVGIDCSILGDSCLNFALSGQDIFFDYNLTKYLLEFRSFKSNIKKVFINMSYYAFDYDLSLSPTGSTRIHRYLYTIGEIHNYDNKLHLELCHSVYKNKSYNEDYKAQHSNKLNTVLKGNNVQEDIIAKKQAGMNHPNTVFENKQIFEKYLQMLNKINIEPIIVILPTSKYYYEYYNDNYQKNKFYSIIQELDKKFDFTVIDYFNSELFTDEDFWDYSHLNKTGALKFTSILKKFLP